MENKLTEVSRKEAQRVHDENSTADQFAVSRTPFHTHNGADSPYIAFSSINRRSQATASRTWAKTGNTDTVTSGLVQSSSLIFVMPNTPPVGRWGISVNPYGGSFTVTSSDSESKGLVYNYLVF